MRPFILAALVPAFLLAGCAANPDNSPDRIPDDGPQEAAEPGSPTPDAPGDLNTDPAALVGEYRVAGAGGREIDLPHAITASISSDTIDIVSECVRMRWTYRLEPTLLTERQAVASCRRGLMPEEVAVEAALAAGGPIRRTPQNGIQIGMGQTSVTLFSQ